MVVTGLAGVVMGIIVFVVVLKIIDTNARGGSTTAGREFDVGDARQRAQAVARDATPLLFQDPLDRDRDIYVQHLGGSDWVAFDVRAPGGARTCVLRWERAAQRFADPCTGAYFAADGTGLVSYPARVDDRGRLLVDLRSPRPPTTTTSPP